MSFPYLFLTISNQMKQYVVICLKDFEAEDFVAVLVIIIDGINKYEWIAVYVEEDE